MIEIKKKPFLEIETSGSDDDLESYNLKDAKEGEFYALKVIERKKNFISFDIVRIPRQDLELL